MSREADSPGAPTLAGDLDLVADLRALLARVGFLVFGFKGESSLTEFDFRDFISSQFSK
jgi:hypothetical protein